MAEVDTSSYLKPSNPQPQSMLGTVNQLQGIESNRLTIQKQQLDQINQGYGYLIRELNSLPADATGDQMRAFATNAVKMRLVQPDLAAQFISQVSDDPARNAALRKTIATKLATTQEAINSHYGIPGYDDNGQQRTPVVRSPLLNGGAPRPVASPIQNQNPPGTPTFSDSGQPQLLGPQDPQVPAGRIPTRGGLPGQFDPMQITAVPTTREPPPTNRLGGAVVQPSVAPPMAPGMGSGATAEERRIVPTGPIAGMPPLFEEGRRQYVEDQNLATQRLTGIKPAIEALRLLPGLRSGPTTEAFTTAVAALKANNIIPTELNDPTAIRQMVNKYLADYVSRRSSNRSDADLAQTEARSPNAGVQISQALEGLTKKSIAYDRIEASRANAFQNHDFSQYGRHRTEHPTNMDERSFGFDFMPRAEQTKTYNEMKAKALRGDTGAIRFMRSLMEARRQNLLNFEQR